MLSLAAQTGDYRICKVFGVKDGVCKAEWIDSDSVLKAKYYPVDQLTHLKAPKNLFFLLFM
jgi:hypothetical protein